MSFPASMLVLTGILAGTAAANMSGSVLVMLGWVVVLACIIFQLREKT